MTIEEVIQNLDFLSNADTVFASRPFKKESEIRLVKDAHLDNRELEASGFSYFLEVAIMREVIEVWQKWRNERIPTLNEKIEAIIYYAENDAYFPN